MNRRGFLAAILAAPFLRHAKKKRPSKIDVYFTVEQEVRFDFGREVPGDVRLSIPWPSWNWRPL